MELSDIFRLMPIVAGVFILLAFYRHGNAISRISDQSLYHDLDGKKLRFRSGELNGIEHGWCLEFIISEQALGLRCSHPKFNYVADYDQIHISKSKEVIGYRVCLAFPEIGQLKISKGLANKINRLSGGKLYKDFT